ncbi:MAG: hypothetical protein IPJ71_03840 [Bdellovibrionales bacterium]|nr:hypothetical protein [Bdellovibrionales bacterium]
MSLSGSFLWNVFLWPFVFLFTATQICSADSPLDLSSDHSDNFDRPSVREFSAKEVRAFAFQTLSARAGSILYARDPARMRWELEIRQVANDRNGEVEITSSLRQVGHRAFPITLKALTGGGSERHHYREVLDQSLQEYNRKRRGQKKKDLQISQDSVMVGSHYFGGKNKITKEYFLFVDWPSSDINLWVVSRSGMGNEKFESGKLEFSKTPRPFDKPQGSPEERLVVNHQVASFSDSALSSYVNEYLVNSGRDQIRLVLHVKEIARDRNGEMELKAGIGLAGGSIQDIELRPLKAAGEFYSTYKAYYNEERLKRGNRNLGFVDHESMVYVGNMYFGGRDQLTKTFYLIMEWPTGKIKMWIVSKKGSGVEKIEKVVLRKFLDGCQEFLSDENE